VKKLALLCAAAITVMAASASAGTTFGMLSNFDAVNDTGSRCHGFEIELEDIEARDITYTFRYQRYGTPTITEDVFMVNGVAHPRTFVRWMSPWDQNNNVFTEATPVAAAGFRDTGGHLCFRNMNVNGQPYDTSGCEHFGVGTLRNPSKTVYRWMKEDPATPGSLIAQGSPVTIPAPVWTVNPNPIPAGQPIVEAVIPVPPPPAVVPVPYRPNAEFGVAVWAKVFETESAEPAELDRLVSDDENVPGNLGPVPNPDAVTEIEWQILQTDAGNPTKNELASDKPLGEGKDSVTRRYEFYQYTGAYEVDSSDGPNTGTNEALCTKVADDGLHGVGIHEGSGTDCGSMEIVGEYIGAQMAAANVITPLSAIEPILIEGEVGVPYPDRPLIFGGSGGPYSIAFSGAGSLPLTDAGNEFELDEVSGVLLGGIPNAASTSSFTIHATDLVDPSQPAVDVTYELNVVGAVSVDEIAIPDGVKNVTTTVGLKAAGGRSPYLWSAAAMTPGLQASVVGNSLSLRAGAAGAYDVEVTVDDGLGGMASQTLTFTVAGDAVATATPTPPPATPTPTNTAIATPTPTDTPMPTDTPAPTATPTQIAATPTPTLSLAACPPAPRLDCAAPGRGAIKLQGNASNPERQSLRWQWSRGTAAAADFGDPVAGSTNYRLCAYDDNELFISAGIDAGGLCDGKSCWTASRSGFKFRSRNGNADGIAQVRMVASDGRALIDVKGAGSVLGNLFPVTDASGVTVQLVKDPASGPECWSATFAAPAKRNDPAELKFLDDLR
jgi:hypothetical protein